jgi:hypothetical protein
MSKSWIAGLSLAAALASGGAAFAQAPVNTTPLDHADWSNGQYWLCRPGEQDSCAVNLDSSIVTADGAVKREAFVPNPKAAIDCFYIYPTVSQQPFTTSDLSVTASEKSVVLRQFARLGSVCRTFAPMYRQITLTQLRVRSGGAPPPARGATGQANVDVDEAFEYYLKHWNNGRGIVFIGHSQGAGQIARLVQKYVDSKDLNKQLVSTLIIGGAVTVPTGKDVGGTFKSIPACRKLGQTGCVISYGSFRDTVPPPAQGGVGAGKITATSEGLCVNPAALAGGKANPVSYWAVAAGLNSSLRPPSRWTAKTPLYTDFATTPGLITTECVKKNGLAYLEIHVNANPADPRADEIPGDVFKADGSVDASWGMHNSDMNISMGNFVSVVGAQAKAWSASHPAKN